MKIHVSHSPPGSGMPTRVWINGMEIMPLDAVEVRLDGPRRAGEAKLTLPFRQDDYSEEFTDDPKAAKGPRPEGPNDFGWALTHMRQGGKVRRIGWTWNSTLHEFITMKAGKIVDEDGTPTGFRSQDTFLATDWVEAPE